MQFFRKDNPNFINVLKWVGITIISFGFTALLFLAPPNVEVTRQYYEFGLERIIFLVIVFTLLMRVEGFWGKWITFTFTLLLFSLSLIYKWQTADNFSTVGGLFPVRDASDYYQGAQTIIHGMDLSGSSTFRPIYTAFLATIMWAMNGNLQAVLIVLAGLNALAVSCTTLEINRTLRNSFFSAIYLVFGYIYFRRFSGTLLTENLGFLLGNLALFFLLRGATSQRLNYSLFGLFLLTVGLSARAGAFLILPVIVLWAAITFRGSHGFWRTLFMGLAVVFIGMAGNWVFARAIHSPTSAMFSNYSYTLYGLAVGNKGWEQVLVNHPGANANEIYALAFDKIKNEPFLFARGIAGAYSDYFVASKGAFSFLLLKRDRNDILNTILWSLSFLGLITAVIKREQKQYSISLAFFAGIMLSVGLVPPIDSTQMRAFATTIPMSLYIVVTGGGFLSEALFRKQPSGAVEDKGGLQLPTLLSGGVLLASFIIPVLLRQTGSTPSIDPTIDCEPGKTLTTLVIADGSSMTIDGEAKSSYIPAIEYSRFMSKLLSPDQLADGGAVSLMAEMKPGTTLTLVRLIAANSENTTFSTSGVMVTNEIPRHGVQTLCVAEPILGGYYFLSEGTYEAQTTSVLSPQALNAIAFMFKAGLWIIFLFVLIKSTRILEYPSRMIPLVSLNAIFIASGVLLLIHTTGLIPLAWDQQTLDPEKTRNPEGFMYVYNLGTEKLSDTKFWDYPSFLYENDALLSQPHESQSLISEYGRGRYILREKVLFFSTSDNSDPKTNGRLYTLKFPVEIRIRYQVIVFTLTIIAFFIHALYFAPMLKNISKETN
ncbi:MAG: hypothetical protein HYZ22_20450 [Chloroflexi bacterium]|nr:hypothetical protein [Chloroflexota bacterium]